MRKISVQLYSLREVGDLDTQLALARACGFDWVESVVTHGLPAADFAARVKAHGLKVSSMHASLALLESNPQSVLDACDATGCALVIMPWLPMGERVVDAPAWRALGQRLARLGDALKARGLRFAYHNHDFEFFSYGGATALESIFADSAAQQVGWEADLGWVCRAGVDPWHWIEKFRDRLVAIHVKDIAPARTTIDEDGWAALGQGVVPWDRLLHELAPTVDLFVFEHDKPKHAESILRTSHAFLARHLSG
jgi:sugar phosphate isomerase/epimerase